MLDSKYFRQDLALTAQLLQRRGYTLDVNRIAELEEQRKQVQVRTQDLQSERNSKSKRIGQAKAKGEDIQPLLDEVAHLGDALKSAEDELATVQAQLDELLMTIPNIPHESVPVGKDESDNVEVRKWGEPRQFDFTVRDHVELGELLGQLDFETASKITGSRFAMMQGQLARLHRALIQFMLDLHTREHGYREHYVPYLANRAALFGTKPSV